MLPNLRSCGLVILGGVFVISASEARADGPAEDDFASIRAWVESQPQTFENEVLFTAKDGQVVRSERFTSASASFGDFDGDGDIDLFDYAALQICLGFSGPELTTPLPCYVFDSDADQDIDQIDVAAFQNAFTGAMGGVLVEAGELFPVSGSPDGYYSGPPGAWDNNALNGLARQAGYTQDDLWYEWSVNDEPVGSGEVIIANSARPDTAYTILPPFLGGAYVFRLKVTNLLTLEFGHDAVTLSAGCIYDTDCGDGVLCTTDSCNGATGACARVDNCAAGVCNLQSGQCE